MLYLFQEDCKQPEGYKVAPPPFDKQTCVIKIINFNQHNELSLTNHNIKRGTKDNIVLSCYLIFEDTSYRLDGRGHSDTLGIS